MRTMRLHRHGPPEDLQLDDVPAPVPGPGEVAIAVRLCGLNPVDWKLGSGMLRWFMRLRMPWTPGAEVVGTVLECGANAADLSPGQRVVAKISALEGGGCAEVVVVERERVVVLPDAVSDERTAAVPLAGGTALQALRDRCGLVMTGSAQSVLIIGASGGVGHLAVQIAAQAGARVTGVCSGRNAELVRSLGAEHVVDYGTQDDFAGPGAPYDIIIDNVGKASWSVLTRHLAPGGALTFVAPNLRLAPQLLWSKLLRRRVSVFMLDDRQADLQWLIDQLQQGLEPRIERVFELADLAEAWRVSQGGRTVGKLLVRVA